CPFAIVKSSFPPTVTAAAKQRERWEQGHLGIAIQMAPRMIWRALMSGNLGLLVLALDSIVPPLTLLASLNVGVLLLTTFTTWFGASPLGLYLSIMSCGVFLVGVTLAWMSHGRDVLPVSSFRLVISYVFAKLGLYLRLLVRGPMAQWTRTDRS